MTSEERNERDGNGMMHVVAYARVWEDDFQQDPEEQFILIREWAKNNNAIIEGEFYDYSDGADTDVAGLQRMVTAITLNKNICAVVTFNAGRVCRDTCQIGDFFRPFNNQSVYFIYIAQRQITTKNAEGILYSSIEIFNADRELEIYRQTGAKPILGQITFRDYLNNIEHLFESHLVTRDASEKVIR